MEDGKNASGKGDAKAKVIPVKASGRTASARHAIVSRVVEDTDPDILLLQETKTKILVDEIKEGLVEEIEEEQVEEIQGLVEEIKKAGKKNGREYVEIAPKKDEGAKKTSWKEAKVLYDSNKFVEQQPRRNELDLAIKTLKTTYHVKLRGGREAGVGQVVKERVSWVCLKRKDGPNAGKCIFFMSFHNYYTTESKKGASVFCGAVAAMKRETKFDVVAGVDFNCEEEDLDLTLQEKPAVTQTKKSAATPQEKPGPTTPVHIPKYNMSKRRTTSEKKKIDYIVTTLNPEEVSVEVVDFTASDGTASKLEGKVVEDRKGEKYTYIIDDFDTVVDHDPLLCTITWLTPAPQQSLPELIKDMHINDSGPRSSIMQVDTGSNKV